MSEIDRQIIQVADETARRLLPGIADRIMREITGVEPNDPPEAVRFVLAMASKFLSVDRSMTAEHARSLAVETYHAYLADEKIKFGDPRYDWSPAAAREVADEYECRYWEPKP
jgi:hypothetical protein